ncbi:MAG TPA: protein kinase [Gemmatimonas sp.]|nr:protein kinase [Gemmatimonas sp.]
MEFAVLDRLRSALADRYRVDAELGRGGMATVYLAHDLRHERDVAIKVLHPDLGAALGGERFLAEIRTTAKLQHPHILPLLDSGDAGTGILWYAMPYVRGETLRAQLERERQLPVDDAVLLAREVADALQHAHAQGIIHRDIKPENILLQDGHALVADFGIALAVQSAGGARMTQTGLSLGTPQYMSPEQAMGERTIDARSDIYALGAVTYEMLAGEPPFTGPTVQVIVATVLSERPVPLATIRDTVPLHVEVAVLRALAKLPADRFASAAAFAAALTERTTHPAYAPAITQKRRWLGVAGATVAALAIGVFGGARLRSNTAVGPVEYDVGLPESAAFRGVLLTGGVLSPFGLAISPDGSTVVYQTTRGDHSELWLRSLQDGTLRSIEGTTNGIQPALSPDGTRVAFIRASSRDWTVEVVRLSGGTAAVLGRGTAGVAMQWLADGRLLLVEGDGTALRTIDPATGATTKRAIPYCVLPSLIPGTAALLCGGGGNRTAYIVDSAAATATSSPTDRGWVGRQVMRIGNDTAFVFGTDFRIVDGRYVTYMQQGDLMAAPFDAKAGRIGRPVRMRSGIGRTTYYAGGTYAVAKSGTLVYAEGPRQSVGVLVRASPQGLDTLPLPPDSYITFALEPGGRRLASVVEGREGDELRIHDLTTGKSALWTRAGYLSAPIWSPTGGRIAFGGSDTVFVGDPDGTALPLPAFAAPSWEVFNWLPGDQLVGGSWAHRRAEVARLGTPAPGAPNLGSPRATVDSLFGDAAFPRVSPDGRWIAYNNYELTRLWLEPFPRTGHRWEIAAGPREEPHWISPTEIVYTAYDPTVGFERARIDPTAADPIVERTRWIDAPRMISTAGPSAMVTGDGRIVYVQGAP